MPTPLQILLDPVSLMVLAIYGGLMLWEALFPGRKLPKIRYWRIRGLISFVVYFYLSSYLPLLISPFLEPYRLLDLSAWGSLAGGIAGVLVYQLGLYWWHYGMHHSGFLWRSFHQMHHSAERLDTYGAFFFSPLDMIGFTLLGTVSFSLLVGLDPQAITLVLLINNFLGIFQHANVNTPRWLGYIVQRPESHTCHHGKGLHKYNYSDLPLYDLIFGTFYNPSRFEHETGFYEGASARIGDMLLFRDVSKPAESEERA